MRKTRLIGAVAALSLVWAAPALAQDASPVEPAPAETPANETVPITPPPVVAPRPAPAPRPPVRPAVRPLPQSARQSWIATIHTTVPVRVAPRDNARVRTRLLPTAPFAGGITQLSVTRSVVRDGVRWLEVLLPMRPNGARGWIHGDLATLRSTQFRVEIRLRSRQLIVFRAGRTVARMPVAVGKSSTPTPTGRFAIAETVRTNLPGGFLGPIVLPITGYSRVLNEFAGGDGRVAIHGTSVPSLIGLAVSAGCVRMRNSDIVRLARLAPPGTPLLIRA